MSRAIKFLLATPLLIAAFQLTPLPPAFWRSLPGHDIYLQTLELAGAPVNSWRPLSLAPQATFASLLAGLPLVAAFLLSYYASRRQLRGLLRPVVLLAVLEVALGLVQVAAGEKSSLFFGAYGARPVGTFANANHYANYLAMAMCAVIWLGYEDWAREKRRLQQRTVLWAAAAALLLVGVLLARSRGAVLFGLPPVALAFALVFVRLSRHPRAWQFALVLMAMLLVGAVALIGVDVVTSRASVSEFASSAGYRGTLTRTTFEGAMAFWPWGSGWGTYDAVYPRFQPALVGGFANHAHMDYVEMLFEGGILILIPATVFAWTAVQRVRLLAASKRDESSTHRDYMAAAICGLGLLGFLLHSMVEFNMRIPANAILAALLAGAFLRLLDGGPSDS